MNSSNNEPQTQLSLRNLPKYHLSHILSFLNECNGGTSTLLTNQYFYKEILPIFEIRFKHIHNNFVSSSSSDISSSSNSKLQKIRHYFIPLRTQDPDVLLERLNTKRLYRRLVRLNNNDNNNKGTGSTLDIPYPVNMSTKEIAHYEWSQQYLHNEMPQFPQELELLRFLDSMENNNNNNLNNINNNNPFPPNQLTVLTSYPRCGNTLLRSLFEKITCQITGSDTKPDRTLSKALSENTQYDGFVL